MDMDKYLNNYVEESREHLQALCYTSLLELEKDLGNTPILNGNIQGCPIH